MKKTISIILCSLLITLCLAGCSSPNADMTEENITETVNTAFDALKSFDTKALDKYVDSSTLSIIMTYAEQHDQFVKLGQAIFSNLDAQVKEIDIENRTVTVTVINKDLAQAAGDFASSLKENYNTIQLLRQLNDESFLDTKLGELCEKIDEAAMQAGSADITLSIEEKDGHLVLVFDENAEDAVSGGALTAVKSIFGGE